MSAYLILLFAVLSRLLPLSFHTPGLNFTALGASLLFFGARRSRWQTIFPVAAFMATDFCLTVFAYHYPFHIKAYLPTWIWYAAVCLMGHEILRRTTALRVVAAVLASATSFFLLSNFVVWTGSGMYPHSAAGLAACYVAGLPFYGNDLLSTSLCCAILFGLPVLAARLSEPAHASGRPVA